MLLVNILFGISVAFTLVKGLDWAKKKALDVGGSSSLPAPVSGSGSVSVGDPVLSAVSALESKPFNSAVIEQKVGFSEVAIANKLLAKTDLKFSNLMPVAVAKQKLM